MVTMRKREVQIKQWMKMVVMVMKMMMKLILNVQMLAVSVILAKDGGKDDITALFIFIFGKVVMMLVMMTLAIVMTVLSLLMVRRTK